METCNWKQPQIKDLILHPLNEMGFVWKPDKNWLQGLVFFRPISLVLCGWWDSRFNLEVEVSSIQFGNNKMRLECKIVHEMMVERRTTEGSRFNVGNCVGNNWQKADLCSPHGGLRTVGDWLMNLVPVSAWGRSIMQVVEEEQSTAI